MAMVFTRQPAVEHHHHQQQYHANGWQMNQQAICAVKCIKHFNGEYLAIERNQIYYTMISDSLIITMNLVVIPADIRSDVTHFVRIIESIYAQTIRFRRYTNTHTNCMLGTVRANLINAHRGIVALREQLSFATASSNVSRSHTHTIERTKMK